MKITLTPSQYQAFTNATEHDPSARIFLHPYEFEAKAESSISPIDICLTDQELQLLISIINTNNNSNVVDPNILYSKNPHLDSDFRIDLMRLANLGMIQIQQNAATNEYSDSTLTSPSSTVSTSPSSTVSTLSSITAPSRLTKKHCANKSDDEDYEDRATKKMKIKKERNKNSARTYRAKVRESHNKLVAENNRLKQAYAELEKNHAMLQTQHNVLTATNTNLTIQNATLSAENANLTQQNVALKQEQTRLEQLIATTQPTQSSSPPRISAQANEFISSPTIYHHPRQPLGILKSPINDFPKNAETPSPPTSPKI